MGCEIFKITAHRVDNSADVTAEREGIAVSIYAERADKSQSIATQLQRAEMEISAKRVDRNISVIGGIICDVAESVYRYFRVRGGDIFRVRGGGAFKVK
jgi:hypothetical protein